MSRAKRQAVLLELIANKEIETQKELTYELKELGLDVTQATISRDIKELGLVKVTSPKTNKQKYVYSEPQTEKFPKLIKLFQESVLRIDAAENLIVLKTISGSANAACLLVDKLNIDDILGSIAGDDTALIVVKSRDIVSDVIAKLNVYLR